MPSRRLPGLGPRERLAWLALVAAGCGGSAAVPSPGPLPRVEPASGYPLRVIHPDGGTLELTAPPGRVLPTNAGVVDFLTVLLPPERVAGVPAPADRYSRLAALEHGGWRELPRFPAYTAEVVLALDPDLVVTNAWQSPETTALLAGRGVPVLVTAVPEGWQGVQDTLALLGRVLGVEATAAEVAAELEARVRVLGEWPRFGTGLRALSYTNLGSGGTTAGAGTTIDLVLSLAGIENAAREAGLEGHASIDHELLLVLDPDLVLVGDDPSGAYPASAEHLFATPALASLAVVRERRVVALPVELLATTSLELVTAAEELQRRVDGLLAELPAATEDR